jgi:hypothetical protein
MSAASTTTIRISRLARQEAHALARSLGKPMSEVVEGAIHAERRRVFWEHFRAAAAGDAEQESEAALYQGTLPDGLEAEGVPR